MLERIHDCEILSYGGGLQTLAQIVLVKRGILPRPDFVIAADTGREMPSTWRYADEHVRPLLAQLGLDLHVAAHDFSTVDIYAHNGDVLLPAYTATGKLSTYCSSEWKARVVHRYARRVLGVGDYLPWIGFSTDERERVKTSKRVATKFGEDDNVERRPRRYPLLELMLSREDCARIVADEGLPQPHKSRCYMCPHQSGAEWIEVFDDPALWAAAVELDDEIRDVDAMRRGTEHGDMYLSETRKPLRLMTRQDILDSRATTPDRQCGLGLCFV